MADDEYITGYKGFVKQKKALTMLMIVTNKGQYTHVMPETLPTVRWTFDQALPGGTFATSLNFEWTGNEIY